MTDEEQLAPSAYQPTVYQIRIKGHLGQHWIACFEGLTITREEDGNTLLSGAVVDQSALYGILKKIRDLGAPLLSVNSIELKDKKAGNP
ncbi:MAG: hypothetical protein R3A44_23200 [Caldilineaceae bacterium]